MTEQRKHFPEFYVTAPQPCPYLPGRLERKLFTHLTHEKSPVLVDNLLRGGFRRSQNIAYMPYCEGCQGCVSVRVLVSEFIPSRSMRRVLEANSGLASQRLQATPTSEQYSLFRSYIDARHADGGMADMSVFDYAMMVEDSIIDTFITEYRLRPEPGSTAPLSRQPLVAAALCDRLSDGISMVYSFYDPEAARRGLGTYMILDHIAHAKALGLPYVYLGYWINGSSKMSYKRRFQPQERLTSGGWSAA
ncbi:MAG TPA: arginyltransferase [Hyphomicrobiaceae bacterium]|jgi:arginine-tRNA-protein transferase|nr:arginyltransferase [Hyphomicrobiaceae bacterium]